MDAPVLGSSSSESPPRLQEDSSQCTQTQDTATKQGVDEVKYGKRSLVHREQVEHGPRHSKTYQLLLSAESFQQGDDVVMSQAAQHLDFTQGSLANNLIVCTSMYTL